MPIDPKEIPTFDELMELAQNAPDAFDELKREICEKTILQASSVNQPRLRAQQTHIDRLIARGKNPYHTITILMKELYAQAELFHRALHEEDITMRTAEIIPLYPNKKS